MTAPENSLLRAWGAMMGLSTALAVLADSMRPQGYILAWAAFICVVAYWKARIVLSSYLGLRVAPGARAGFSLAITTILAMVFASFVLQRILAAVR